MTTLEKYIWVVNALYRAGSHGLSLKELSDKWERDESISYGEPLPRQTFNRWKDNILMSLGVNIYCRLKGGYRYYISNPECLANGELLRWLLDTYSTANTLSQNTLLKDRILVEEIPSSRHFLTDIVDAMKGNNIIMATYRNFHYKNSYTFPIAPYCLKMFQKRWYVLALSINEDRLRIYGLDRFENIEITKDNFKFPSDFNAKDYFSSFFGVVIDEDIPLQRIVVRAFGAHQHYMRSLPLHLSQKELYSCNEYADFELTLRPTYDFIMELQSYGTMIEVMEPQSLRQTMKCCINDLSRLYKSD